MNLIRALKDFDGKRTSVLERLSDSLPRNESSLAQLWAVSKHADTKLQVGATWILKRWFEEGEPQLKEAASILVQLLENASHWEVRLHLLQMLASSKIPAKSVPALRKVLTRMLTDENKFVRAWGISVLAATADQYEAIREDVISILLDTELDDAASVRARVRQIRNRYKWTIRSG